MVKMKYTMVILQFYKKIILMLTKIDIKHITLFQ